MRDLPYLVIIFLMSSPFLFVLFVLSYMTVWETCHTVEYDGGERPVIPCRSFSYVESRLFFFILCAGLSAFVPSYYLQSRLWIYIYWYCQFHVCHDHQPNIKLFYNIDLQHHNKSIPKIYVHLITAFVATKKILFTMPACEN